MSLAALRRGGMLILLTVVLLVPFANLWFYATMGYQYVFGLDTLQTALAMAPAQVGAIVGALVTRKVLQRKGIPFTGTVLLVAFAVTLAPVLLIGVDSPLWVPILVFGLYAAAFTGASIPITNAIMNTAPHGEEGSASAFRSASGHLGSALGVVFTTAVLATAITTSLNSQLSAQGMDGAQSEQIAQGIIDGATSEDLSAQYSVPVADVDTIGDDLSVAMVDGLHLVATTGSVIALPCAGAFRVAVRRQGFQG
ncbi:MAG: MFS transporter [Actinobacteria bacterium]|nr:MFS transporter [Actinomycetota bacterium]MCB8997857.1 MFS transporter [Actinomycetota bacterium]MCB9414249.1 MFS transporter [Actinomycetota bacterium]MCB9423993.1 MFS transporter [Actinomycetota bacterium]